MNEVTGNEGVIGVGRATLPVDGRVDMDRRLADLTFGHRGSALTDPP